ncbi:glycerol kinase GlpK [Halomarina salina]|uniref:glycerol kinase n=1 Tax=Halomarina salina TaxID=1872699 RepID=A0ABD5RRR8_9EURY|nr:glycerol kinase GlpK [Halomarina salina]
MEYVVAVDQSTTGTRAMAVDRSGAVHAREYLEHEQSYPEPGWVEHDATQLLANVNYVLARLRSGFSEDPVALGITNQRETAVAWDAETGQPLAPAIVRQDRRTTDRIDGLADDLRATIRERTGLEPDAYFSATKFERLLDREDHRERARSGEVLVGTVDAWLCWSLGGEHATDVTNASRTMLFDIERCAWDETLCEEFGVPMAALPDVRPSSGSFGETTAQGMFTEPVPIAGVLGDQQAALFGQACFDPGSAKTTYGTGSFLLQHTGEEPVRSDHGLLTTVAYQREGEPPQYALEGSVFTTGAAVEWLADVGIVDDPEECASLAESVESPEGVFGVPAFSGLGAPHWDQRARGTVVGLTRGTTSAHLARATLEAIAFQTRAVAEAMEADSGRSMDALRVDGGAVENDALCRIQADALDVEVVRSAVGETTALGAAYAAGLSVGFWDSTDDLREQWRGDARFVPSDEAVAGRYDRWQEAVERARDWAREE